MVKINSTNLISEPRNNVVALISNPNNVTDPITSNSEFRKWIYSRDPSIKNTAFEGYPFIIVGPTKIDTSGSYTLDSSKRVINWTIDIEVVSSDYGYGEKAGKGLEYNDSITNNILQTLLDVNNRAILRNQGMAFGKPVVSDVFIELLKQEKVYRRIVTLPFDGNWTKTTS